MQKNTNKPFYRAFLDLFLKSLIVSSLCSFTAALYRKISQSITGAVCTSYAFIAEKLKSANIIGYFTPDIYVPKKSFTLTVAQKYERSLASAAIEKIKWSVLTCQLNVLSMFGLTFGFVSALMLILENFAFSITKITLSGVLNLINPLMTSFIFILVAILFIFSKKPLIRAVNESLFLSFILFDFLAIRNVPASDYEQYTGMNAGVATLLGILLGGIAPWVTPSTVAAIMGMVIVFSIILHSPEAGVIGIIFMLPFLPTMAHVFLVCSTALSFFFKCCRRKRIMKFEGIDLLVSVFALFTFSGGVISVDIASSLPKMLVFVCFLSIYFIIKNIVRTETLIYSCATSLASSAMVVAILGIFEYLFGEVSQIWQDADMFESIRGRAVSTFGNPNVLGEYLIICIPVIFAMFLCAKSFRLKMLFFLSSALCCICLVFTWSRGAWLGLAFAAVIFILFKSHTFLAGILLASPALLFGLSFVIDGSILERILSIGSTADSSTAYRMNIWHGTWRMLGDTWAYGIGTGTEAFASVFPRYALSGTEVAPHTHSLYLQLISETGIFSLISFALICLAYFSLIFSYIRKATGAGSRTMSIGFLSAICAFLVQGFTDYVWYNYRVYLFFWIILGFSMAVLNLCKENDGRKYTYE